jgi:26S proteasome regulatory subunit T4
MAATPEVDPRQQATDDYKRKLLQHKEFDSKVRSLREDVKNAKDEYEKTEDDLKALQSVGQIIGEVLRQLDEERCEFTTPAHHALPGCQGSLSSAGPARSTSRLPSPQSFHLTHPLPTTPPRPSVVVKSGSGPRYVVGCRAKVDRAKLVPNTRVALDVTTLTIMRILPREVDPVVFNMTQEDPGKVDYSSIGGLGEQIRELREAIELPLVNPELFARVGIKPPTGVLLYGPPGTGKTLLAKAIASNIDANFLKVVASGVVDKYIGESARVIREMFGYAREHQPCIIFMDEIDAIGGKRFSEGTSADREVQRTLMELLSQLDGFEALGKVKMVAATNRPDVLDPALMRPGRLDRKIEIPLPNEQARMEIIKIHASKITKHGEIDYEAVVKLADRFNGADLRNVCTEAGMFAIRDDRDYVVQDDLMKAVRKLAEAKKLEHPVAYSSEWGDGLK